MKVTDNRLIRATQKNWPLIIPFLSVFALLRVSPMMYDGWAGPNSYKQFGGLIAWFEYVLGPFRQWINGRAASNFFCGILESFTSEIPLDAAGALLLAAILYCLFRLFPSKNRVPAALTYTALLILMPYLARTYVVQIALLQYIAPLLFLLLLLLLLRKYAAAKSGGIIAVLYVLCAIACTWMENSSVAFGVVLVVCSISIMLKNKRVSWALCGAVAFSLLCGLFMVTSPGLQLARVEAAGLDSIFAWTPQHIYAHITNIFEGYIYSGGIANLSIACILAISSFLFVEKNRGQKGGRIKALLCIANTAAAIAFFRLCQYTGEFYYTSSINKTLYTYLVSEQPALVCLIFLLYLLWLPVSAFILCGYNKYCGLLSLYGLVSVLFVLPTNQIGWRIYVPLYMVHILLVCVIVSQTPVPQMAKHWSRQCFYVVITVVFVLAADYEFQLCERVSSTQQVRMDRIEELRKLQFTGQSEDRNYYLPLFNERDIWLGGNSPIGTYHYPLFLQRYGLDAGTKIIFGEREPISFSVEHADLSGISVQMENYEAGDWTYAFLLSYRPDSAQDYIDILYEEGISEEFIEIPITTGAGDYRLSMAAVNADTGEVRYLPQIVERQILAEG